MKYIKCFWSKKKHNYDNIDKMIEQSKKDRQKRNLQFEEMEKKEDEERKKAKKIDDEKNKLFMIQHKKEMKNIDYKYKNIQEKKFN